MGSSSLPKGKNKQNYQKSALMVAIFVQSGIIGIRENMQGR